MRMICSAFRHCFTQRRCDVNAALAPDAVGVLVRDHNGAVGVSSLAIPLPKCEGAF